MTLEELKKREKELRKKYGDDLYEKLYIKYSAARESRPADTKPPVYKPEGLPTAAPSPVTPNIPVTPPGRPLEDPPKSIEDYMKNIEDINKRIDSLNRQQYEHMLIGNDNKVKGIDLVIKNAERIRDSLKKQMSAAMGIGSESKDKDMLRAPGGGQISPPVGTDGGNLTDRGYADSRTDGGQISAPTQTDGGDLRDRGYADSRTDGGQIFAPTQTDGGNLTDRGYADSRTDGGQISAPTQTDGGNLTDRGYADSRTDGGQVSPSIDFVRNFEVNKEFIKAAKTTGEFDNVVGGVNIEDLTPQQAQQTVDDIIDTFASMQQERSIADQLELTGNPITDFDKNRKVIEQGYKIGLIYTDAKNLTPEQAQQKANKVIVLYQALQKAPEEMTVAELDAVIEYSRQNIDNQIRKYEKTMEIYWEHYAAYPEIREKISDIEDELRILIDDDLNGIGALEDEKYYARKREARKSIEDKVNGADDYWEMIACVIGDHDPTEELLRQIYDELGDPSDGNPVSEGTKAKIDKLDELKGPALIVSYINGISNAPLDIRYKYCELTYDEKNTLLYLYAKGMIDDFNVYWESLDRELDKRQTQRDADAIEEVAARGDFEKISAGAYSILANLGTPGAWIESALQAGKNLITGEDEPVNKYSALMRPSHLKKTAREASLKDASPQMKELGNLLYGIADTAITLPFGPQASFIILTSQDMGNTAFNVVQGGGSAEDAFFAGVLQAGVSYMTNKIPFDELTDAADTLRSIKAAGGAVEEAAEQTVKDMLIKAGIKGSKSLVSTFTKNFLDWTVMGNNSRISLYAKELREKQGLNYEESMKQATNKFLYEDSINSAMKSSKLYMAKKLPQAGNEIINNMPGTEMPD